MKSLFLLCLAICAMALVSSLAFAQATTPAQTTPPSAEHQRLAPLVGQWDVTIKFHVGPGKLQNGTATCTSAWFLDGKFVQREYRSLMNGQPFTVLQILGYDTRRKQFTELSLNSIETAVLHNTGEHFDSLARRIAKLRSVYTVTD